MLANSCQMLTVICSVKCLNSVNLNHKQDITYPAGSLEMNKTVCLDTAYAT